MSFFRRMIKAAQLEGTVSPEVSATAMSQVIFSMFLGLRVISRAGPDQGMMKAVYKQVESLLT